mgnify:CR=1 FL=1
MPFSFSKFKDNPDKGPVYRKIIKRFILLFIFGMIVQGNLLGLDPKHLYLYSNTLQAIATGYLIAAIIQLHCNFRWQLIVTALLLVIYWIPMTLPGRLHSGRELCREGGQAGTGAFPRRSVLE